MFSPALGRAVRSTYSISPPTVCTATRPASVTALSVAPQTLSRRPHQRRLSSSKASIPPDNSNGSSSTQETQGTNTARSPARKLTGRAGRRKPATPILNVPHVPPTDYLQKPDVKISSFFSLHRPISVTSAVPPVSTSATFDSIFQAIPSNSRQGMFNNIQTLSSGIESLEAALRGHEGKQAHDEIPSEDVKHLDGAPQISIDQMLARFIPFSPPPAPVPLDQIRGSEAVPTEKAQNIQSSVVTKKSWRASVVVTESTDAAGMKTYSASTTPMVEINVPESEIAGMEEMQIRQPFLGRMRQRGNEYNRIREDRLNGARSDMHLISVKRQRKLKMKKHKYKKLMRKTRLLRRKLDRN